jgi:hypothetical protein
LTNIGASNGLLRDYFPKGTDLSTHSMQHLLAAENELNKRPRIVLNDRTPAELFGALLASKNVRVATLTRTRLAAKGSVFTCRRQLRSQTGGCRRWPRH